jgi:hypothetical protein
VVSNTSTIDGLLKVHQSGVLESDVRDLLSTSKIKAGEDLNICEDVYFQKFVCEDKPPKGFVHIQNPRNRKAFPLKLIPALVQHVLRCLQIKRKMKQKRDISYKAKRIRLFSFSDDNENCVDM